MEYIQITLIQNKYKYVEYGMNMKLIHIYDSMELVIK